MDIERFLAAAVTAAREAGLAIAPTAPGVPALRFAIGPFPAALRIGFDASAPADMEPDAVLEIDIGEVADHWPAVAAWSVVPELAMAEHSLPHPLPRPDLAVAGDATVAVHLRFRTRLSTFDTAVALVLLHVGTAYASFMARELARHMRPDAAAVLAAHGLVPDAEVPLPGRIMSTRGAVLSGAA